MKKKIIAALKYLLSIGLGALLFYLAFKDTSLEEIKSYFVEVNYLYIAVGLVFALGSHLARAIRWQMLLKASGYKADLLNLSASLMVGYLVNVGVPRAGEISRCAFMYRTDKIPVPASIGTVVAERVVDLLVLMSLILLFLIVEFQKLSGIFSDAWTNMAGKAGNVNPLFIAALIILPILGLAAMYFLRGTLKKFSLYARIAEFLKTLIHSAKSIGRVDNAFLFFLYTAFIWLGYILMTWLPFLAVKETSHLSFYFAIIVMTMGGIGMTLPAPGGIGSYHFAVILTFIAFGLTESAGLRMATIIHTSQLVMMILIGVASYFFLIFRKPVDEVILVPGSLAAQKSAAAVAD